MPGSTDAWAVGYARVGNNPYGALVEHWDGAVWKIVPSAPVGSSDATFLNGTAATAPADVWAVGADFASSGNFPTSLIEHWNGLGWTRIASPQLEPPGAALESVSADSASDAWAVGYHHSPSTLAYSPLIEHWNGSSWSVVSGASGYPSSNFNRLEAVAALTPSNVWALGVTGQHPTPVIEHWNGSKWTIVGQPANNYDTFLTSISALSANDIWAVGGTQVTDTLTENWNGTSWQTVPSPNATGTGPVYSTLAGVAALSSSNVWAVGSALHDGGTSNPLIEHWNGASWSIVAAPSPKPSAALLDVAGLPNGPVFAVGWGDSNGVPAALILEH